MKLFSVPILSVLLAYPAMAQEPQTQPSATISASATETNSEARSLFEAGFAAYDKEQFEEAFSCFQQAADLGCAPAQYLLGECYYGGRGVKPDRNKANELWKTALPPLRKSAEAGDAEALYLLGLYAEIIYQPRSSGYNPPEEQFREFYRKAAELGYPRAEFKFAVCYRDAVFRTRPLIPDVPAEALKWYRKAAEAGYAQAQYALGRLYEEGKGVEKDEEEALDWYSKAADGGWARAMYRIGICYEEGKVVWRDKAEALKWYRKAAEAGYPCAQFVYGRRLDTGDGVERDEAEAAKWYRKASEQDLPAACSALAECYANGRGMEYDIDQAAKWNIRGDQAYFERVLAYNRRQIADVLDPAELDRFDNGLDAEMIFSASGYSSEPEVKYQLAESYFYGRNGLRQNYAEAVKWYRNTTRHGSYANGLGFGALGFCYEFGKGVDVDLEEAEKWYTAPNSRGPHYPYRTKIREMIRQARDGDAETAYRLGVAFANGIGTKLDIPEALKWLRLAAEKDHPGAFFLIGRCYAEGNGIPKDPAEAVAWYRKAAEKGLPEAQTALGKCLESRFGVRKDAEEAFAWYRKAAEQGFAEAPCTPENSSEDDPDAEAWTESRMWYALAAERGNPEAQYRTGMNYSGEREFDRELRRKWLTRSAEQGYAPAMYRLGYAGIHGGDPAITPERGEEYLLAAAFLDYVPAMKELAAHYSYRDRDPGEAVKWLLRAQEKGLELDTYQMYTIGQRYAAGDGVKQDKAEAVKWYLKSAEDQNGPDSRALLALGDCYYAGDGVRQDKAQAAEWYGKAAEKGGWKPKVMLAVCYRETRDERYEEQAEKAAKALTAAASGDRYNEDAQLALATCYERGIGFRETPSESFRCCSRIVENPHVSPTAYMRLARCYRYGIGVEKDRAKAEELFVKAAMMGSPEAQFMLGGFYEDRKDDPVSCANALRWYQAAAEHGYYPAERKLAQCYQNGLLGVKRDPYLAVDIQNEMGRRAPQPVRDPLRELGFAD